ncbi:hypothetical protein BCR44DRAFT_1442031 [Catenaria anguillulae PL171]|uniref:Uncharacterized protein n=1 Tax=Catenaria anguillulae PL171 TaxID=765915 RepID=A0A1Y2HCC4_9FUNG|nr:hypothetical protein BCR44DRAFT_1442031 [Catenaria anguillulae PL171]
MGNSARRFPVSRSFCERSCLFSDAVRPGTDSFTPRPAGRRNTRNGSGLTWPSSSGVESAISLLRAIFRTTAQFIWWRSTFEFVTIVGDFIENLETNDGSVWSISPDVLEVKICLEGAGYCPRLASIMAIFHGKSKSNLLLSLRHKTPIKDRNSSRPRAELSALFFLDFVTKPAAHKAMYKLIPLTGGS